MNPPSCMETKVGTYWMGEENDAIVEFYFLSLPVIVCYNHPLQKHKTKNTKHPVFSIVQQQLGDSSAYFDVVEMWHEQNSIQS